MHSKCRIAVVGLGRAGSARVRALTDHPRATLAGIVRRSPETTDLAWQDLLDDPAIVFSAVACADSGSSASSEPETAAAATPVAASAPAAPAAVPKQPKGRKLPERGTLPKVERPTGPAPQVHRQFLPELQEQFQKDKGKVRILALLSPT